MSDCLSALSHLNVTDLSHRKVISQELTPMVLSTLSYLNFTDFNHRKVISQEFDTPGLLSDQRNTELWIGWYNGLVEAGTGTVVGQEVCAIPHLVQTLTTMTL